MHSASFIGPAPLKTRMQNLIKLCKSGVPCLGRGRVFAHMAVGWHREGKVEPRCAPGGWVAVWGGTRELPPHNKSSTGWEKGLGLDSMGGAEETPGI